LWSAKPVDDLAGVTAGARRDARTRLGLHPRTFNIDAGYTLTTMR